MSNISDVAAAFFDACKTGQGWDGCAEYCTDDASFAAQSEAIGDLTALRDYAEWMKGTLMILPDATYDLKSWDVDADQMDAFIDATGVNGFNVTTAPVPWGFEQVVEHLVPELQQRGRLRTG